MSITKPSSTKDHIHHRPCSKEILKYIDEKNAPDKTKMINVAAIGSNFDLIRFFMNFDQNIFCKMSKIIFDIIEWEEERYI